MTWRIALIAALTPKVAALRIGNGCHRQSGHGSIGHLRTP
jgi:hypothetical protein